MTTRNETSEATDPIPEAPWWRRAVVYQVYLRSFADADGDGTGDIAGLRARLRWIRDLGADAVWVNPWYPSPMVDGGYDVADYRAVDPRFGTLDDVRGLLADAHALGLRVLADIVPNHTSAEHAWFREALATGPGSAARARYLFRDGRGPGGDEPPNNWLSIFGGPAWTRTAPTDCRPAQWYCHLFDPLQPDLDWSCADVRAEFESILRFWFDLGVDGFRIDVAQGLVKAEGLPDVPDGVGPWVAGRSHPYWGQEGVHGIFRAWRRVADAYPGDRVLVGEVGPTEVDRHARMARFVRPDELHEVFNFDLMAAAWDAAALRAAIEEPMRANGAVGAPVAWVLGNHDTPRQVTRYGRASTAAPSREEQARSHAVDVALGTRRARAAALLLLALPGPAYLYAGEELGLPDVDDLPDEVIDDPVWRRSGHTIRGRDACRVPLPWAGERPPFGFSAPSVRTWLPQPAGWAALTAGSQERDPASMLALYRSALAVRRSAPGLAGSAFGWVVAPDGVIAFARGAGFRCVVNISGAPVALPSGVRVILRSDAGAAGPEPLAPDAAAWVEPDDGPVPGGTPAACRQVDVREAGWFRDLGIEFFKIDFLYAGALPGPRHAGVDPVSAYRDGLRVIRAAAPDAYLLGCGAPILPSVGLVDAMRVSPDTAPEWEPPSGDLAHPSGRARAFQHGRFWVNDADCLIVRPAVERRDVLAEHVGRFGGLRMSSDRLADLDEWGLAATRRLLGSTPPGVFTAS